MPIRIGTIIGLLAVLTSFTLVVFGFLKLFPLFIATPLLFLSIFYLLSRFNSRNRSNQFKGFKSI
ncbi:hypothetical protein [Pseudalkalibacillus berkeleyi]|uniref:Membrane transport protein MMPL domain-containing protein n=1 Tax=Pseudalkalibacillus berkeleyi TaxID=1069813 RepID=A0ABS9GVL9_9BACL|nr:hypothetical protein [Pseudalkalibacillus berkeleyi]MCF6136858.1 hypothetical protein [Pseudalkalibacillus berkeleyi]